MTFRRSLACSLRALSVLGVLAALGCSSSTGGDASSSSSSAEAQSACGPNEVPSFWCTIPTTLPADAKSEIYNVATCLGAVMAVPSVGSVATATVEGVATAQCAEYVENRYLNARCEIQSCQAAPPGASTCAHDCQVLGFGGCKVNTYDTQCTWDAAGARPALAACVNGAGARTIPAGKCDASGRKCVRPGDVTEYVADPSCATEAAPPPGCDAWDQTYGRTRCSPRTSSLVSCFDGRVVQTCSGGQACVARTTERHSYDDYCQ